MREKVIFHEKIEWIPAEITIKEKEIILHYIDKLFIVPIEEFMLHEAKTDRRTAKLILNVLLTAMFKRERRERKNHIKMVGFPFPFCFCIDKSKENKGGEK